jgi:hypothetical protein
MAYSIEEVMSVSNSLSESEFADLEHFVATNQVNIMCMNKFHRRWQWKTQWSSTHNSLKS